MASFEFLRSYLTKTMLQKFNYFYLGFSYTTSLKMVWGTIFAPTYCIMISLDKFHWSNFYSTDFEALLSEAMFLYKTKFVRNMIEPSSLFPSVGPLRSDQSVKCDTWELPVTQQLGCRIQEFTSSCLACPLRISAHCLTMGYLKYSLPLTLAFPALSIWQSS